MIWLYGFGVDGYDFVLIVLELVWLYWLVLCFVFLYVFVWLIIINNGVLMCGWYDIVGMDFCLCVDMVGV